MCNALKRIFSEKTTSASIHFGLGWGIFRPFLFQTFSELGDKMTTEWEHTVRLPGRGAAANQLRGAAELTGQRRQTLRKDT